MPNNYANGRTFRERLLGRLIIDWQTGCWNWTGAAMGNGYGHIGINGRMVSVHRACYEFLIGPVPDGLQLDHLCCNRLCANPAHLEPVTQRENLRRGAGFPGQKARQAECLRGHAFDESNTYVRPNGRHCKACQYLRNKSRRQNLREVTS